jgi:phytoene dehydrogenase-like protein
VRCARYDRALLDRNVVIIGGGIAGLAASVYLARGGRTVTLFEKRRSLGGRAVTHLRHGYRFNLGPHAFYQGGAGAEVLRELGIPLRGGVPNGNGIALYGRERYKCPGNTWSLLTTRLLSMGDKLESAKLLLHIRRLKKGSEYGAAISARQWLDQSVQRTRTRETMEALLRLATYCHDLGKLRASAALQQLRLAMRGVLYVDEGWQKIVDALHTSAVTAGVNFVTSSRVLSVNHQQQSVRGIEIGGLENDAQGTVEMLLPGARPSQQGARLAADTVLLAVEPQAARELVPDLDWPDLHPVVISSLDVGLSRLPDPKKTFALGIDRPFYFSVHSRWAQLTPKGGALIHVARYGGGDESELETLLDEMQPGWRALVVHCRFLPSMVVSNGLIPPAPATRPAPSTSIRGLFLAGDWIGDAGLLSDASLASARAAAQAILASS